MRISELNKSEYNPFYQTYIDVLGEEELLDLLKRQLTNFPKFLASLPEDKLGYAYSEGKWTIAEALLHIIDTERVFQYRALRFLRGDKTPLPGFNQDTFVPNSNANSRSLDSIIDEYQTVRKSTLTLFSNVKEEALNLVGVASDSEMSVAAMGFIICGHQKHHRNVIRERYL